MDMDYRTSEDKKWQLAKARRYKKAAIKGLTLDEIQDMCSDIIEGSEEIAYASQNEKVLEDALGSEDEIEEFKTAFSMLSGDAQELSEDLNYGYAVPDDFDDWLVVMKSGRTMGFDECEGDYFGLDNVESEWAVEESAKRLMRHTKREMVDSAMMTMKIALCAIGLKSRYDDLKCTLDILRDKNEGVLELSKAIEREYEKAELNGWSGTKKLDELLELLPAECWVR